MHQNPRRRIYGLNITISNCSNNYGPYQFPEKLIPLCIVNLLNGKPLPIYGDGKNIRDWLVRARLQYPAKSSAGTVVAIGFRVGAVSPR